MANYRPHSKLLFVKTVGYFFWPWNFHPMDGSTICVNKTDLVFRGWNIELNQIQVFNSCCVCFDRDWEFFDKVERCLWTARDTGFVTSPNTADKSQVKWVVLFHISCHSEFHELDDDGCVWLTADGSGEFPAEAGRYHLYCAYACPWAHRTLVARRIKVWCKQL